MSCGVGCRCSSNLALLWLWHRPADAAPIQLPYAMGVPPPKKERSQTEKDKYYVITYVWDLKNKTSQYNKTEIDSQIEQTYDYQWRERERERGKIRVGD